MATITDVSPTRSNMSFGPEWQDVLFIAKWVPQWLVVKGYTPPLNAAQQAELKLELTRELRLMFPWELLRGEKLGRVGAQDDAGGHRLGTKVAPEVNC